MVIRNRSRSRFDCGMAGWNCCGRQIPVLWRSIILIGTLVIVAAAAPATAQDPPPPMTEEERQAWLFSTPEGQQWGSLELREERFACVVMENRVDILRAVVEHLLLGQPHEEDPEGLDAVRRALESESFRIVVRRAPPLSLFEKYEIDDEDAASLTRPLEAALRDRGLASLDAPGDPGDRARYQIGISHPGDFGSWISSTVEVLDLRSGKPEVTVRAKVGRIDGEWRVVSMEAGRSISIKFSSTPYVPYQCPQ